MGQEIYFSGNVELKPGTTFTQIRELWLEYDGGADEDPTLQLPLSLNGDIDLADLGSLSVDGTDFAYHIAGYSSYSFSETVENFLADVANKYAAEAWISYEGCDEDGHAEIAYGPTPRSILVLQVSEATEKVTQAQLELSQACAKLAEFDAS